MRMSDNEFEKKMEEYRKSADGIHLSDEARERINQGILHRVLENQSDVYGSGGRRKQTYKYNFKDLSLVWTIVAVTASVAILVIVGISISSLSGQESGQMISRGILENSELQSELSGHNGTEQDANKEDGTELINTQNNIGQETDDTDTVGYGEDNTENSSDNNGNVGNNGSDSDNNSDESDKVWLTTTQLLEYYANEISHEVQACTFVSYNGMLMYSTDSDTAALHFKRDGDGEIIYNEENAYDAYLVEEMENAIAIVVDGHVCVYEEMEDIIFTIDGVSYGISYALYNLIGTEEHSGDLIADEDGVKVYEWLDADGQVVEGKYFVDISDILVELMPDPYANGEDWAEFYWVATEIT